MKITDFGYFSFCGFCKEKIRNGKLKMKAKMSKNERKKVTKIKTRLKNLLQSNLSINENA